MSGNSNYEWGVDCDADARRILDAAMPDAFWHDVAAIYDDAVPTAGRIKRYDILGDTFEMHPTFIRLLRGDKHVRGFNRRNTVGVAYKQRKAAQAEAKSQAKKTRDDARIVWDTE